MRKTFLFMVLWHSIYTAYSALSLVVGIPGQTAGIRDHRHEDYIVRSVGQRLLAQRGTLMSFDPEK